MVMDVREFVIPILAAPPLLFMMEIRHTLTSEQPELAGDERGEVIVHERQNGVGDRL